MGVMSAPEKDVSRDTEPQAVRRRSSGTALTRPGRTDTPSAANGVHNSPGRGRRPARAVWSAAGEFVESFREVPVGAAQEPVVVVELG